MATTWQMIKRWPNAGKIFRDDGTTLDVAELFEGMREGSISCISLDGKLFRTTFKGVVPQESSRTFVQQIPPGLKLKGYSRVMTVFGGRINDEFRVGGEWTSTIGDPISMFNFDETLDSVAQSTLIEVEAYTGGSLRSQGIITATGTGANRSAATQTQVGAIAQFDSNHIPVFRFTNPGNADVTIIFELTFSENNIE